MEQPNQSTPEVGRLINSRDYSPLLRTGSCWDVAAEIISLMLSHSSILFHRRYTEPAPYFWKSYSLTYNDPYKFYKWSLMF